MGETEPLSECLERNLRALSEADPGLARRLTLPVRSEHVGTDSHGTPLRDGRPFVVPSSDLGASVADLEDASEVFVFGIGLGEQVAHVLRARPDSQLVVWDRDPWLVRLALGRRDFASDLSSGRLRISMGADLIDEVPKLRGRALLLHPELAAVYEDELVVVRGGVGPRRAIVGLGGLMVADLGDALRAEGYTVFPVDFPGSAREELVYAFDRIAPEIVATVNYIHGLAEFCQERRRRLICWEIDPSTDRITEPDVPASDVFLFTFRRANVPAYKAVGFRHVHHLPLAAEPSRLTPLKLDEDVRERYGAPVSFVGSSMVGPAATYLSRFLDLYTAWHPEGDDVRVACERQIEEILEIQVRDLDHYVLPELALSRFGGFFGAERDRGSREDPLALLAEVAASRKRLARVAALASFEIQVWGDPGWTVLSDRGVRYRGRAGHFLEIPRIYNASQINIDIGRAYQSDIVTMRVFDVLACGGFLIAERSDDLEQLFRVGREIECYASLEELKEKVRHYLANPDQARALADRGLAAVRERHRLKDRVRYMLDVAGSTPPVRNTPLT